MIHEQEWYKRLTIYQIYPRSFQDSNGDGIGDLKGILSRLDYLEDLGINAIWLSPVYASPNVDNGYDISDYRQIMPEFGTMKDWDDLLEEAHHRGIAIIMDLVLNHTSDQHRWFQASKQSREGPYSDYYIWRDPGPNGPPNQWRAVFGGSAWEYVPERGQYYLHLFAKEQPDLNWANPKVRAEVYDTIRWWTQKGVDGFRVDAISYLDKGLENLKPEDDRYGTSACANLPGTHRYIQEMIHETCKSKHLMTVGEVTCYTPDDLWNYTARQRGEFDMAIPFVTPFHELTHWSPEQMKEELAAFYEVLKEEGWWARFLSNHDKPRQVSLYGNDGEYWEESAKLLAALLHTLPGTPFIYQGEEIGMTNIMLPDIKAYDDIDTRNFYENCLLDGMSKTEALKLSQAVSRDNARSPMQWDGTEYAGFTSRTPWLRLNPNYPRINVSEQKNRPDSILSFYRQVIRLRRENDALIFGDYAPFLVEETDLIAYRRQWKGSIWGAVHNFSTQTRQVNALELQGKIRLSNYGRMGELHGSLELRPYESLIWCEREE